MGRPDVWLILGFGLLAGASYGLWCFGRLPRMRLLFIFLSVLCLGAGVVLHDLNPGQDASNHGYYP